MREGFFAKFDPLAHGAPSSSSYQAQAKLARAVPAPGAHPTVYIAGGLHPPFHDCSTTKMILERLGIQTSSSFFKI